MLHHRFSLGPNGQWVAAIIVSMSSFVSGTFLSWPGSALPKIRDGSAGFTLTENELSWAVALSSVGSLFSPIPCCYLMDKIGRKNTLLLFDSLILISWALLAFCKTAVPIYIARFLCGLWGGAEYVTVAIYVCEIAEPRLRGSLGTICELMLFTGALFESAMSAVSYQYLIAASAVPAVILFFGLIFVPESPYFYLMKGDRLTASENVKWLRGKCTIQDMDAMESSVKEQLANTAGFGEIFSSSLNLKPFIMVQCLKVIVGSSSIIMLMSYASTLLPDWWISAKNGATLLSFVWVVSGLFACSVIDKMNRRTFLYISCVGTALALSCTTVWYYLDEKTSVDMSSTKWVPLLTLVVSGIFETGGIFNVPNVVKGELFAINIKSKASALCCMTAFLFEGMTTYFFYPINNSIGLYFNFGKIVITSLLCILVSKFLLIETRGRSLEEIQYLMKKGR